jgi:hypothetical protein
MIHTKCNPCSYSHGYCIVREGNPSMVDKCPCQDCLIDCICKKLSCELRFNFVMDMPLIIPKGETEVKPNVI